MGSRSQQVEVALVPASLQGHAAGRVAGDEDPLPPSTGSMTILSMIHHDYRTAPAGPLSGLHDKTNREERRSRPPMRRLLPGLDWTRLATRIRLEYPAPNIGRSARGSDARFPTSSTVRVSWPWDFRVRRSRKAGQGGRPGARINPCCRSSPCTGRWSCRRRCAARRSL